MKRFLKFNYFVVLVSCLLYGAVALLPFKAKSLGDLDFHVQTKQLAQVLWGNADYNSILINKAPGPILFYVTPYFLAGPSASDQTLWLAGVLWSFLFLTAALIMIRKAATNMGHELAGRIAVIFLLLLPLHLYYSLGILAEGFAFFGCSVFLLGWSIILRDRTSQLLSTGWISFIIGALCMMLARPNSILIVPFLLLILVVLAYVRKDEFYRTIQKAFFGALICIVFMMGSLTFWIKSLPANKSASSQEGYLAYVMLIGRFQFRSETWDWRFWDGDNRADSKDYQGYLAAKVELKNKIVEKKKTFSEVYYDFAKNDIVSHPVNSIKQFIVRAFFGHVLQVNSVDQHNFKIGPFKGKIFFWIFHIGLNAVNGVFIVLSFFVFVRRDFKGLRFLPLLAPWLALVVFHGIVYMEQRYLFPVRPVIVVLGAIVLAQYLQQKVNLFKKETTHEA